MSVVPSGQRGLAFVYDKDGLLTTAGALTVSPDLTNGRLTGTAMGLLTDSYGYDPNTGLFALLEPSHAIPAWEAPSPAAMKPGAIGMNPHGPIHDVIPVHRRSPEARLRNTPAHGRSAPARL